MHTHRRNGIWEKRWIMKYLPIHTAHYLSEVLESSEIKENAKMLKNVASEMEGAIFMKNYWKRILGIRSTK
jgi:hypothetical protein